MDPFKKQHAGDPLGISATSWNVLMELARWWTRNRGRVENLPVESDPLTPTTRIYIRNDTGGDLAARSVVGLSTPPIDPTGAPFDAQRTPLFSGIAPAADGVVAVVEGPLADGTTGRAILTGVAVVSLGMIDAGHKYCGPTAGETGFLTTAETGPIRILWAESGTGAKLGIVLLQQTGSGGGITTANVDGSEESTTTRLEFDEATGIRVDAGTTDADPDTVSIDPEVLSDLLVMDKSGSFLTQGCLTVVKTYSTNPGETHLLTDVSASLVFKRRAVSLLSATTLGEEVCIAAETSCCTPAEDPVTVCSGGAHEATVSRTLKVVVAGGPTFFLPYTGFGYWYGYTGDSLDCDHNFGLNLEPLCDGTWAVSGIASFKGPTYTVVTPVSTSPFLLVVTGATETGLCGGTVTFTVEEV